MSEGRLPPESKSARNERRKAVANTLNALSVAALGGGGIPVLLGQSVPGETILLAFAIFVAMQGALHAVLRNLED